RTRRYDSDVERGKRQLQIIEAVVDKSVSITSLLKLDNLIKDVDSIITTTLTFKVLNILVDYVSSTDDIDIESYSIDGYEYQPAGVYYWQLDEASLLETRNILKEHLELTDEDVKEDPVMDVQDIEENDSQDI